MLQAAEHPLLLYALTLYRIDVAPCCKRQTSVGGMQSGLSLHDTMGEMYAALQNVHDVTMQRHAPWKVVA